MNAKHEAIATLLIFLGLLAWWSHSTWPRMTSDESLAGAIFSTPTKALRVLIVPGHDPEYYGAHYGDLREADLTLELARQLAKQFRGDKRFQVAVVRDLETGDYIPDLADYFQDQHESIWRFRQDHELVFDSLAQVGMFKAQNPVHHGFANQEVSTRLYGINKWANEHDVDVVLHLHFNDYPGHREGEPGKYHGFAVYVPERQYVNALSSIKLGELISERLGRYFSLSNLPQEAKSVVEDQDLIAVGAKGTRLDASVLVEYGYIYEPMFSDPASRAKALARMAEQTYLALRDYAATVHE